ncbi:MAG: zinc-ribbon domain-containing protein [Terriglobales bacterium]
MSGESYSDPNPSSAAASQVEASVACPHCGTEMPPSAAFCPACGWSMKPLPAEDRILAAVAYFTFVPAGVLLLLPGFRPHRFIRFHAWQSALIWGVFFVLTIFALLLSNLAAAMAFLIFGILASLAMLFLWIVLSIKAWQGERFELPWFGTLAGRLR